MADGTKVPCVAVKFYIKGPHGQGTVKAEAEQSSGILGFGGSSIVRRCWFEHIETRQRIDVV